MFNVESYIGSVNAFEKEIDSALMNAAMGTDLKKSNEISASVRFDNQVMDAKTIKLLDSYIYFGYDVSIDIWNKDINFTYKIVD